jgi:hypothetical protein
MKFLRSRKYDIPSGESKIFNVKITTHCRPIPAGPSPQADH